MSIDETFFLPEKISRCEIFERRLDSEPQIGKPRLPNRRRRTALAEGLLDKPFFNTRSFIMRIDSVNTYNPQPNFGHVIKTRFFEVLPDNSATQIQSPEMVKSLYKRLSYHLGNVCRQKKNRIHGLPEVLSKVDSDYAFEPSLRRIFNFNRPYDSCVYLITGKDALSLNSIARTLTGSKKNSEIIEQHWKLVRDNTKRLKDENSEELALNIFLKRGQHPKTGEECFLYRTAQFIQERLMHFPHRLRGENLK